MAQCVSSAFTAAAVFTACALLIALTTIRAARSPSERA
jgi:hypothetical protein